MRPADESVAGVLSRKLNPKIDLALRAYGEPVGKLSVDRVEEYDAVLRGIDKGSTPDLQMPAMDPDDPSKAGAAVDVSWTEAIGKAENKHLKPDESKELLTALRADEVRSLADLWASDSKQFRKLLDAFIEMGRLGLNNTTKQAPH